MIWTGDFKETEAKMLSKPPKPELGNVRRRKEGDLYFPPSRTAAREKSASGFPSSSSGQLRTFPGHKCHGEKTQFKVYLWIRLTNDVLPQKKKKAKKLDINANLLYFRM